MPPMLVAPPPSRRSSSGSTCCGRVVDAGHQRRDQHAGRDARAVQLGDRLQPRARVGRVRLGRPPRLLVERRDRQARAEARRARRSRSISVEVAQQQRRLRQHRARVARRRAAPPRSPASAGSAPRPTGRGRCSCPARRARLPRRPRQLGAQHLRRVDLDDDLALEVPAGVEVRGTCASGGRSSRRTRGCIPGTG